MFGEVGVVVFDELQGLRLSSFEDGLEDVEPEAEGVGDRVHVHLKLDDANLGQSGNVAGSEGRSRSNDL